MTFKTLYTCGIYPNFFSIITMALFTICFISFIKYRRKKQANLLFSCILIGILNIIVFFGTLFYTLYPIYCLNSGKYKLVEGYLKDFTPMPPSGHPYESFKINNVYFEYSNFLITMGYRKPKCFGGVIKDNGQYLRIYYISFRDRNNYIIKIEEGIESYTGDN